MATAANKNKIRTFEAEIGPQNKNIEAGEKFYWFLIIKKSVRMSFLALHTVVVFFEININVNVCCSRVGINWQSLIYC